MHPPRTRTPAPFLLPPSIPLALLLPLLLPACTSNPPPPSTDIPVTGLFPSVRVTFWTDGTGASASHLTDRTCADGARVTREHLVALDLETPDAPPYWADVALECQPDGAVSRVLVLAGLGHEPSASPRRLSLQRAPTGRWSRVQTNGSREDLGAYDACLDAEIEGDHASPSVAVRRLRLAVGETREFDRLLVTLPALDLSVARRRLTRVGEAEYAFEGLGPDGAPVWRTDWRAEADGTVLEMKADRGLHHRAARDITIR